VTARERLLDLLDRSNFFKWANTPTEGDRAMWLLLDIKNFCDELDSLEADRAQLHYLRGQKKP